MIGGGKEYGVALFELASEDGCCEEVSRSLAFVNDVFREVPEFIDLLSSPAIPREERLEQITRSFVGSVHDDVIRMLCVLVEHGRIAVYSDAANHFEMLYRESTRRSEATVTSAVELTPAEKERLQKMQERRTGGSVELHYQLDESLLGGMIVELEDGTRMDGSLKHRLRELKEVMTHDWDSK